MQRQRRAALVVGSVIALAVVSVIAFAQASLAQREENATFVHASMAAGVATLDAAHVHLHHAINCLVGVGGPDYSAAAEASSKLSCKAMDGHGAIADANGHPALQAKLERALALARAGAASPSLTAAQGDAKAVAALLRTDSVPAGG